MSSNHTADSHMTNVENKDGGIDEGLYSRQLYVFGFEAQKKMAASNVLLVGLKGLGVEIAKNVILAGVKSVTLLDNEAVELRDLSSQFYLTPADLGKPRAACSLAMLASLNQYVKTSVVSEPFSLQWLEKEKDKFSVVVLTGRTLKEYTEVDAFCHQHGIKFIAADIHGLFGSVYVDVGQEHWVSDPTGERPLQGIITNITQGTPGIVTVHEDKRHGLQTGDHVQFEEVEGMVELNGSDKSRPIKVITPFSFSIEDTSKMSNYTGGGLFFQVKVPKKVSHEPLSTVMTKVDKWQDMTTGNAPQLHLLRQALSQFQEKHKRLPQGHVPAETKELLEIAQKIGQETKLPVDEKLITKLGRCSAASISPMAAFLGGIVGQEVLKAASGKFMPLDQAFYYESVIALPAKDLDAAEYVPTKTRYDDQVNVFGRSMQMRIAKLNLFLVGAGAIGCEMLKNWAMMGAATEGNSRVFVTDMDSIEKSNLNRQFLFRSHDVGKQKSQAAAAAARVMNPQFNVESQTLRVGKETESVYNDDFWLGLDAVCTALDNIDARRYVDQRCVYYQRPMIDSGTLGTKGNTQAVIPFKSESYSASYDPPEEDFPVCTIKLYPNRVEHTIQWSLDQFDGLFKKAAEEAKNYATDSSYLKRLSQNPNQEMESLRALQSFLVTERPKKFEDCIVWARKLFESEFYTKIRQLLHNFPEDTVSANGVKFWSGPKRAPVAISFDLKDPLHAQFVVAAANLHAFNYGIAGSSDLGLYHKVISHMVIPPFEPKTVKIAKDDAEAKQIAEELANAEDHTTMVKSIQSSLPPPAAIKDERFNPVELEKDDDKNHHMDFITACSNLRARNYRIKEESKHNTKAIAGKIIPAVATTTALVTGLVCIELYKVLQDKPLDDYRNCFVNLSLPLFTQSEPMAPAKTKTVLKDRGNWEWSAWDRLEVNLGNCTLKEFITEVEQKFGYTVGMLSYGSALVYADFNASQKSTQKRLGMKMTDVIEDVSKHKVSESDRFLVFEVCLTDEDGNDINVPSLRLKFR